jgi:hypothetical protein
MEMEILRACGEASIMIMGMSFVVGSLTTVFVLVLLDMYRSRQVEEAGKE